MALAEGGAGVVVLVYGAAMCGGTSFICAVGVLWCCGKANIKVKMTNQAARLGGAVVHLLPVILELVYHHHNDLRGKVVHNTSVGWG